MFLEHTLHTAVRENKDSVTWLGKVVANEMLCPNRIVNIKLY